MKFARITLILTAALLLLAACKKEEEPAATANANPLLAYVPAETPFLIANLEPTPTDVVDAYLERFKPTFEMLQAMLDDMEIKINSDGSDDMQQAALLAAIVHELDGKLNRAGLESLGLSLESHKAFYGMGVFPIARVALRDPEALRAAVSRIETEAGMTFPETTAGNASYWKLASADAPVGLYVAILADHLAVGAFPVALETDILPNLLAQAEPQDAFDAGAVLAKLNTDKGFLNYGSGYLDFRKLAAEFTLPESRTQRGLRASGMDIDIDLDPVCTSEIAGLIDKAPRLVLGTTELSANAAAIKYQLEMEPTLAGELAHLVSDVPPAGDNAGDVADVSLALQVGRLREFLLDKAMYRASNPFQCEQLQSLNTAASQALERMNQPMPPFIGNLNGLRLRVQEVDFSQPDPKTSRGLLVLEVEKPQMLVGSAQMFVPGLENLELQPGDDPVEVPQELLTVAVDGMHIFAAMSKDALGVSLGEDQSADLMKFLEAEGDNGGTFLSISYDMAAQMQFQETMNNTALGLEESNLDDEEARQAMDLLRQVEQSYRDMLGRARLELRFVPQGFEIESRVTFK